MAFRGVIPNVIHRHSPVEVPVKGVPLAHCAMRVPSAMPFSFLRASGEGLDLLVDGAVRSLLFQVRQIREALVLGDQGGEDGLLGGASWADRFLFQTSSLAGVPYWAQAGREEENRHWLDLVDAVSPYGVVSSILASGSYGNWLVSVPSSCSAFGECRMGLVATSKLLGSQVEGGVGGMPLEVTPIGALALVVSRSSVISSEGGA